MNHQILSVTFEVDAQAHKNGRFSVPSEIAEILGGLKNGDHVHIVIQSTDGLLLYTGEKPLASGREIYGADLSVHVKAGQRIRVTISKP